MSAILLPECRDLLALTLVPGLGPRLTQALLDHFGGATAARQATVERMQQVPHIGPLLARQFVESLASVDVEPEIALTEKHGVTLLPMNSLGYPTLLREISDAPPMLYLRGSLTPADGRAVALVGSRQCTSYGKKVAERLATGLARAGITVISGLARGIDGVAHRATLQAGGRTLAVLANGLCRIYPPEHRELADEVAKAGAVMTEGSMEQDPLAGLFPARNRIISGLSRVVVLVEAAVKSGALITATHAGTQGRTVMAVPGPIDSDASGGCNDLLRKGGIVCRSVDDILEELDGVSIRVQAEARQAAAAPPPPKPTGPPPGLDAAQLRIWDLLSGGIRSVDELAQHLKMPVPQLSTALMMMEMKKVVRRLPGNRYERC
jgi:DNA processing protein